jgi:hypothetical protein
LSCTERLCSLQVKILAELVIVLDHSLFKLLLYQPVTRLPQPLLEIIGVRVQF